MEIIREQNKKRTLKREGVKYQITVPDDLSSMSGSVSLINVSEYVFESTETETEKFFPS